ncbi:MAG: calcium/sodium antiporter [Bdellovibrionales bacterium]|nr:calcium/sodium antiporter [Bdellovibrionales bacterium]
MELLISLGMIAIGLVILIFGAEYLVKGASSVARGFGVTPLVIGLTVVAFGTSTPELTVNLYSVFTGATDIAIGNIVGSNIGNILLILGISALIAPLAVQSSTVKWEIPLALLAMLFVLIFGSDVLFDGAATNVISRSEGLAFIGFFIIFMFYIFAIARNDTAPANEGEKTQGKTVSPLMAILLIIGGLAALVIGGKLLVDNAIIFARFFGLSESVIGLTIVAIGTSLPEMATSIIATLKKEIDIAVGNIVGSNIFNVFWILGLSATIAPLPTNPGFMVDALVGIGATTALMAALFIGKKHHIDRWQGALFILAYVGYVTYLLV